VNYIKKEGIKEMLFRVGYKLLEDGYTYSMSDSQEFEVDLVALVYGGDAIGRLADGRAVFIPFGLPGERVRARLTEEKKGYARARLVEVLRPSQLRIVPRCPHFTRCGGCHYQQMPYVEQLKVKEAIVREQLVRIGELPDPPLKPIRPSPQEWNYRNAVQFHLDADGKVGYQKAGSHEVIAITECSLPEVPLNELWPRLKFEPDNGLERLELRLGQSEDFLLELVSTSPEAPDFTADFPISVVHRSPAGELVLSGSDFTLVEVLGVAFQVSAGSFFQVNTPQAGAMVQHVLELAAVDRKSCVLDVYCGVGLFSLFLAQQAGRVIGVESAPSACEDFAANLNAFDQVELYEGLAEDILPYLDAHPDVIVVDPPRAGIEREALDALIRMDAPVLVYVSCDPSTLARDAKRLLKAGYNLEQATPFDLFPQTYHVECIALFRKLLVKN
jgi:23S rRNA (uracil1939-C5)-methyltransferase